VDLASENRPSNPPDGSIYGLAGADIVSSKACWRSGFRREKIGLWVWERFHRSSKAELIGCLMGKYLRDRSELDCINLRKHPRSRQLQLLADQFIDLVNV
jgi:hypothetical protein